MLSLFAAALPLQASGSAATPFNPRVLPLGETPPLHEVLLHLDDRRVVFVGETHDRYDHHLVQLETLKFLHQRHPDIAVGVEWFQYPFQQHLDDYIAGEISEAEMLERTGYFERWRFDYRLYRPIVEYARANRIPVIALNAPVELTRKVGELGIANLPDELKTQLPSSYDRSDLGYERRLRNFFSQHPNQGRSFDNFIDVMLTWDETMAERAALHLQAHPGRRMVIFTGSGHIVHRAGIPDRLERRVGTRGATLLVGLDHATAPNAADYAVLSDPVELPPPGLLGAFLEATDDGVQVIDLADDSAIGKAGVTRHAVLLAIDEQAVESFAAVKLALLDRAPGDKVKVKYRHKKWFGKSGDDTVEVTLQGEKPRGHP